MTNARRGEVWLVDPGLAAKTRPARVASIPFVDLERAVCLILLHTTALRGTRFEVVLDVRWPERGAFDVPGSATSRSRLVRRLGALADDQMTQIEAGIRRVFGIT